MRWPTDIHGREVMPFGFFAFLGTGVSPTDDAWQAGDQCRLRGNPTQRLFL